MPGFVSSISNSNEAVFANNGDFSGSTDPSELNGLQTDGQLWIGSTTINAGGTHINVGALTSTDSSITVGYSSPNITLVANGSVLGKTITGNSGGALSPTAGNWNVVTANSTVKFAGSGSTLTQDFGLNNLYIGNSATAIISASSNVAVGQNAGKDLISGIANVFIGTDAARTMTASSSNVAVGDSALRNFTSGDANAGSNIAIGSSALGNLLTGTHNVSIGPGNAGNYTGAETSNIVISSSATTGDNNTIRIGTQGTGLGQQNRNFQAGITGVTVAASEPVAVASTGQLSGLGFGTSGQVLTSNGAATSPTWQAAPAFTVRLASDATNVTGDGTIYQVAYDTVLLDNVSAFTTGSSARYTIPTTGNYRFEVGVDIFPDIGSGLQFLVFLQTTARQVLINNITYPLSFIGTQFVISGSITLPMTIGDTAYVAVQVAGGSKTCTVFGSSNVVTWFSGSKV